MEPEYKYLWKCGKICRIFLNRTYYCDIKACNSQSLGIIKWSHIPLGSENVTTNKITTHAALKWDRGGKFCPCCDIISQLIISANLKVMMLGCLSLRRCLMSVSLMFRTFFTATSCPCSLPRKTAPWAPLPTHCRSDISSKGTSHASAIGKEGGSKMVGGFIRI